MCQKFYFNYTMIGLQLGFLLSAFKNDLYHTLLLKIKQTLLKEEYRSNSKNKNVLRISVQSLGSPIWMSMDCDDESHSTYGQDLIKFLYCLRVLLRNTNAVAFITIPSHLFDVSSSDIFPQNN